MFQNRDNLKLFLSGFHISRVNNKTQFDLLAEPLFPDYVKSDLACEFDIFPLKKLFFR